MYADFLGLVEMRTKCIKIKKGDKYATAKARLDSRLKME